jgi:hypothetical protein
VFIASTPANPDVLLAVIQTDDSVSFQRVFRTTNGGERWARVPYPRPSGSTIRDISLDPIDATKFIVTNTAASSAGIVLGTANSAIDYSFSNPGSGYPLSVSSFTATRHGTLAYAFVQPTSGSPAIYKSSNSGSTWTVTGILPTPIFTLARLRTAPSNNAIVYGTETLLPDFCIDPCQGGVVSTTGGTSWVFNGNMIAPLWISPSSAGTALRLSPSNVFSTANFGTNFLSISSSLLGLRRAAAVPNYPTTPTFFLASAVSGILKTQTNGTSYTAANDGFYGKSITALDIGRPVIGGATIAAGIEFDTGSNGVNTRFISTLMPAADWVERPVAALGTQGVPALVFDRTTTNTLYAGATFNQLLKSTNNGAAWTSVNIPSVGIGSVHALALDERSCAAPPSTGPCTTGPLNTLYIGGNNSPGAMIGGNAFAIYKSTNGGTSFSAASTGLVRPSGPGSITLRVTKLLVDPNNSANVYASTALIGAAGSNISGIFKSTNGAASWSPSNTGLPALPGGGVNTIAPVTTIAISPVDSNTLYAGVFDSLAAPSLASGIYRSSNAGLSWSFLALPGRAVSDIAVDSADANRIFASFAGTASDPGGVARSLDGGTSWTNISAGLPGSGAFKLVVRGNALFAGTNSGVYTFFQAPDADLDNVESDTEDAAPNVGDLNVDGIMDSQQSKSASFVIKTEDGTDVPSNDPVLSAVAATLAAKQRSVPAKATSIRGRTNYGNGDIDPPVEEAANTPLAPNTACSQLNNIYGIDSIVYPADIGPGGIEYDTSDVGLINVEVSNCASGVVTVIFDDGVFTDPVNWVWRNYGPVTPGNTASIGWYSFTGARRINSRTWRLTLNANAPGVYRTDPNSLLLRGGPAFFPERLLTNGFE